MVEHWHALWGKCKQHQWLIHYASFIQRHFKMAAVIGSWPGILVIILPLAVIVGLMQVGLNHLYFGLPGWLFNTIVLLYCLDTQKVHAMIRQRWFKKSAVTSADDVSHEINTSVSAGTALTYFNRDVFAVIFWFCILGAFGALLYRAVNVWRENAIVSDSALNSYFPLLTIMTEIADWIPVRLLGLSLALMGDFSPTFHAWFNHLWAAPAANEALLQDCGKAALHKRNDTADEKEWLDLGFKGLVTWLVILALMTIVAVVQ
jgi:AmpE protein